MSARTDDPLAWRASLPHDPLPPLLDADQPAVRYWAQRDLLGASPGPVRGLWDSTDARSVLRRQQDDGRWRYPGGKPDVRSIANYDQLETYRQLGVLVSKFGVDHRHPAVRRAVSFLQSFQSDAGDFRGIYGQQYSPNYTAAIAELMILAGFLDDHVDLALRWLLSMRQDDGGWAIPTRTLGMTLDVMATAVATTYEPDRSRPSAHLVTGIVLRALVAHPRYRRRAATREACELLKHRFFTRDTYPDHAAASYWLVFSYPFWWTDLVSSLDVLTKAGFTAADPDVERGLAWFRHNQDSNGMWNTGHNRPKRPDSDEWVALAICRVLRRAADAARARRT